MKIKLLLSSVLASLLLAGSAFAMDSAALEEHMKEISEQRIQKTSDAENHEAKVDALEEQVEQLEELIRMMMEEGAEQPS
jgi:outer membrane murein-binding lipoprotein Lpp